MSMPQLEMREAPRRNLGHKAFGFPNKPLNQVPSEQCGNSVNSERKPLSGVETRGRTGNKRNKLLNPTYLGPRFFHPTESII